MSKIASVSLVAGLQRAHPEISMHAVILLVLALLVSACTDGSNDTIRSAGTATPTPTPAPAPVPPPTPASFTLVVTKTGTGTITSNHGGITCDPTCSNSYAGNTDVTLTATPGSGSAFSGWSGACVGAATTCVLPMTANRSVSATFAALGTAGVIFQDDFNSGNILKTLNGAAFWINGSEDAKDPYATKPSDIFVQAEDAGGFSLRVLYAGTANLLGDARPQLNFELGGALYPELWVSFRVYIPQNYFHRVPIGTGNNKFFIIDNNIGTQYIDFEVWPRGDGSDRVSFNSSYNGVAQGHIFPANDWTLGAPEDRGKWHNYLLHLKLSTSTTANNGVVQAWKNGVLVMDFQGLPHYTPAANYFGRGYIFGAANSGFNEDTELRLDDVVFSDSPP